MGTHGCRLVVARTALMPSALLILTLLAVPAALGIPTWTPDERLTNDPGMSEGAAVAVDPTGNVHVVWHDDRPGNLEIYYKRSDGSVWTGDERLTYATRTSGWPRIAADRTGKVHVVWYDYRTGSDNPQIYYKRWDGISWTEDQRISTGSTWAVMPTVVTDPYDHVHVFWYDNRDAGNWEIYYKRWDGSTWTDDERLTFDVAESRYPDAAADALGNVYLVWQDRRDGNWEIYFKQWNGTAWTPDERLTNDTHDGLRPRVAVDPIGNIHVVWYDNRDLNTNIYYKRYDGIAWTPDMRLSDADSYASTEPAIVADIQGRVYVAWSDERNGSTNPEIYFKAWDGIAWSADERLTDSPGESAYPALAVDRIGTVQLAWDDRRDGNLEIYYKRRSAPEPPGPPPVLIRVVPPIVSNFGSWDVTAIGMNFTEPATLALIPEHGPLLVGTTLELTETSIVARFDLTGALVGSCSAVVTLATEQADTLAACLQIYASPWSDELRLTNDSAGSSLAYNGGHAMVRDPSGELHLFWFDTRDGNLEIYWKTRTDGVWSTDQRLTNDTGMSSYPVAASAALGPLLVAWQDTRDGNAEIYAKIWSDGVWSEDQRITSENTPSLYPSLTSDPYGSFHLVWQDGRSGSYQIYYSRMTDWAWTDPLRLTHTGSSSVYPSIVSDSAGRIYVAWADNRDGNWEIYSTRFIDGSWEPERRITSDASISVYPSLAADGDTVFVVWQDDRDGNSEIYLRRLDIQDTDRRITVALGTSSSPMLAVTEDHQLHVVWSDTRTGVEQIWYKVFYPFDGTWSLDNRMSGSNREATLGSILAGPNSSIDVVWRDLRDGNNEIYARTRGEVPAGLDEPESAAGPRSVLCWPNPFRDWADLRFDVPRAQNAVLQIFDVQGRKVRTLVDAILSPGVHKLRWDTAGENGLPVGSGVYFFRLDMGGLSRAGRATCAR